MEIDDTDADIETIWEKVSKWRYSTVGDVLWTEASFIQISLQAKICAPVQDKEIKGGGQFFNIFLYPTPKMVGRYLDMPDVDSILNSANRNTHS